MRIRIKKKKSDPYKHLREKRDLNPHESDADPQPWFSAQALYLDPGSRPLGSNKMDLNPHESDADPQSWI